MSPTASQMRAEINVITKIQKIDIKKLEEEINDEEDDENSLQRNWFNQLENLYKKNLKEEWIKEINKTTIPFNFFVWLEYYTTKNDISNVYYQKQINVQTTLSKNWKLMDGTIINQNYISSTSNYKN